MQWAATWLYAANRNQTYLKYIQEESIDANVGEFNWDLKYAATQILLTQVTPISSLLNVLFRSFISLHCLHQKFVKICWNQHTDSRIWNLLDIV